jgi:hypothetical protein
MIFMVKPGTWTIKINSISIIDISKQ